MSSRCACDHCSLSLCSGVGVADECKHWNTHFSGSLVSYFLQKFQFQHGCLLNPSPAGRKSSHFQSWVTQTQRKHWNEVAAEPAVLETQEYTTVVTCILYRYFRARSIMGRKADFRWAFGEIPVREKTEHSLLSSTCAFLHQSHIGNRAGTLQQLLILSTASAFSPQSSAQYFQLRKYLLSTITQLWSCETHALSATILWVQNK